MSRTTSAIMACLLLAGAACKDDGDEQPVAEADGSAGSRSDDDSEDAGTNQPMVRDEDDPGQAGTAASDPGDDDELPPDDQNGELEPSGVDGSKRLDALSKAEKDAFCDWASRLPGIGEEMDCPDGSTVESNVLTGAACVQSLTGIECAATVADMEACVGAQLANPCEFAFDECDPIFECSQ